MRFSIFLVVVSAASALTLAAPYKRDATTIKADINAMTTNAASLGVSLTSGAAVFARPTLIRSVQQIEANKPAFDVLSNDGSPSFVLRDLKDLRNSTTNLADALVAKSPADLVSQITQFKSDIEPIFNSAIAAYS
ncbi:hypothetical protein PQX77_017856 [Marasmius sp. AFHP31]|nr:hypothetical protein PQX77_017856 [Marasmius sp. AFHP31]